MWLRLELIHSFILALHPQQPKAKNINKHKMLPEAANEGREIIYHFCFAEPKNSI